MRVMRVLFGVFAIVVAVPLLLAGGFLTLASQHRAADGSFTARLQEIDISGYAVLVPDVGHLLRRDAPITRGTQTRVRITARTQTGPAFVGLASRSDVERYFTGVPYSRLTRVRLAQGPLPVTLQPVAGTGQPAGVPEAQRFWVIASQTGTLDWEPDAQRGQDLALVVMSPDASPALSLSLRAALEPSWLTVSTWGLLALGAMAMVLALLLLLWPVGQRDVVYVVEPSQVPRLTAWLGLPGPDAPRATHPGGSGTPAEPGATTTVPQQSTTPQSTLPEHPTAQPVSPSAETARPTVGPAVTGPRLGTAVRHEPEPRITVPSWASDSGPIPRTYRSASVPITPSSAWPSETAYPMGPAYPTEHEHQPGQGYVPAGEASPAAAPPQATSF